MKKIIFTCLAGLFLISIKAQDNNPVLLNADSIHKLKKEGKVNGEEWFYHMESGSTKLKMSEFSNHSSKKGSHSKNNNSNRTQSSSCDCWIPRDSSFQPVPFSFATAPLYQNDDGSTNGMVLPFTFCLYGTNVGTASNKLYINNNGNVSFGSSYSTYSPVGFPSSSYSMVAPFWGDVDTEPSFTSGGVVWYKQTPTYLIIQWDSVGVFDHTGQINSFQLIITDGMDPILPAGNNISFCYGEMQWTTGDVSGGTGGFGGSPATVGINKGDGVNYFQVSLFNNSGSTYTGPAGTPPSGIGWLVGRSFYLDGCGSGSNIAPLPTSGGASACSGDTLNICAAGDTLSSTVTFTPPESSQSVTVTATSPSLGSAFSVVSSTSGVSASLTFLVNSTGLTTGYYNVTVTATDNGTPVKSTIINYVIHLLNTSIPSPVISVTPSVTCGSSPPLITLVNSSSYSSWIWSTGGSSPTNTTTVASTSTVQVTVTSSGCQTTGSAVVQIYPIPSPVISGALTYCPPSTNTTIQTTVSGGTAPFSYNWNSGLASTYSLNATGTSTGTAYTVVVTDAHGCTNSASVTITAGSTTPLTITPRGSLCAGADTLFSSITNATSYTWTPTGGIGVNDSVYIVNSPNTYSLSLTINGCIIKQTYVLTPPASPTLSISPDTVICLGASTTLTVTAQPPSAAGYSFTWYQGATVLGTGSTMMFNSAGTYNVVGVNNGNLCKGGKTFQTIVKSLPTVSVTPRSPTYCQSIPDSLWSVPSGGTPPYHFSWTPGGATTQNINAATSTTLSAIIYTVTVTDTNGCSGKFAQVLKLKVPHFTVHDARICPGGFSVFHISNGFGQIPLNYTWSPGATTGTTYTVSSAGTYTVVQVDFNGCTVVDTFNLIQYPKPQASFAYSPNPPQQNSPVTFTNTSTIASPDSVKWATWAFGDGDSAIATQNPVHTYANGGTYTVTLVVASEFGCLDTVPNILNIEYLVIAPNIITPNGDGINEFLAFKNLQYFKNNKLWVYNRWGTQLYHDADYKNNWTGKDFSDGTYFYILDIPDKNQTLKGFFESIK